MRRVTDLDLSGTVKINGVARTTPAVVGRRVPAGSATSNSSTASGSGSWTCPALAARGYEADCDVVIEVADELAPWNAGRWRIRVKDGAGEATEPTTRQRSHYPWPRSARRTSGSRTSPRCTAPA